ncbi:hypothetical protein [Carnimonas bestiolae]|uniref:hypothetical protein n=1 Tax=Carnimonas bestiolae TaxID=3402172 RepID=UPI003EDB8524
MSVKPLKSHISPLSSAECGSVLLRVVIYIAIVFGYCEGMLWDATRDVSADWKFSEFSFTEFSQSLVLGVSAVIMLAARKRFQVFPVGAMIVAMFLLASLIRENDYFLDSISHGFWKWPVLVLGAGTLYYTFVQRSTLFAEMRIYFNTRAFGMFLSGVLATYVFSRLLGRSVMWEAALGDHYLRVVKDAVEECSESLGYLLMFFSTIEFTLLSRKLRRQTES